MKTMHCPPHLRASFLARRARTRTMMASMPMNVAAKPDPGNRDERGVEAGRDRLGQHRLSRPGRAEEEQASFALATRALEGLARLPDVDDAAHLLLRLHLTSNVVELDAPFGVARLERLDLGQVHQQQRAEQDHEVEDQEDRQHHHQRQDLHQQIPAEVPRGDQVAQADDDSRLEPEAPEPGPAPSDYVFLPQLLAFEPEQARPGDQPVERQVGETPSDHDDAGGGEERDPHRPVVLLVEPQVDGGAGQHCHRRGGTGQPPPAQHQLVRHRFLRQDCEWLCRRHRLSVRAARES